MRLAVLLVAVVALTACGADEPSPYAKANTALLASIPVYPGATAPNTTISADGGTEFAARDWTLPKGARPDQVIDWTIEKLQAQGWRVTGKSFNTIRATRGSASLSVGVRERTLEAIANSRGG